MMRSLSLSWLRASVFSGFRDQPTRGSERSILLVALPLLMLTGCSPPRRVIEEVDWGRSKPQSTQGLPPRKHRTLPATASVAVPSNGDVAENGVTQEQGRGGSRNGVGRPKKEPSGVEVVPRENGEVPSQGSANAHTDSLSTERGRPIPALPGRQPAKQRLSAADAARSAQKLLEEAQRLLRAADAASASTAAIEAYGRVLPHADSDTECKRLCGQIEELLNATGRKSGPAKAVPTRFE